MEVKSTYPKRKADYKRGELRRKLLERDGKERGGGLRSESKNPEILEMLVQNKTYKTV